MIFLRYNFGKIILLAFLVLIPAISSAQPAPSTIDVNPRPPTVIDLNPTDPCEGKICNPLSSKVNSVPAFIKILLVDLLKIGIPIIALAIIYCGFLFVAARGNTEKLTKAKDALLYTLIGAAILLGSWAIAQLISETVINLK